MKPALHLTAAMLLCAQVAFSGYAPERPPALPSDWCAEKEGTLTRSTGECMCRYQCEGARCQSGQGMIWYAYKDCPSGCRCLPRVATSATTFESGASLESFTSSSDSQATEPAQCSEPTDKSQEPGCDSEQALPNVPLSRSTQEKAPPKPFSPRKEHPRNLIEESLVEEMLEHGEVYVEPLPEPEDALSTAEALMDWLDDNGRFLFGGAVVLFLTCTILPTLVYVATGAGGGSSQEGAKETAAMKAKVTKDAAQPEKEAKSNESSRKPSGKSD